jgi:TRAP-type C4-dicarboxylate transport system substrate-binding protein
MAMLRGLADGIYYPWSGFTDVKFNEVTTFHIEAPLGGGPGGVWMMKKEYQSLSPAFRKILDANSGEAESRKAGALMDELNQKTAVAVKAAPGQTVVELASEQNAKWRTMVEPMLVEWANISPEHAKVLAAVRSEIANYRAGR